MKRLFKKSDKGINLSTPPPPRALDDIKKELGEVLVQLGNAQYQIFVQGKEVEALNQRALALNQEGAERMKLDKAASEQEVVNG